MNLVQLEATRAQKLYEYGDISYEIYVLEERIRDLHRKKESIELHIQMLESEIDQMLRIKEESKEVNRIENVRLSDRVSVSDQLFPVENDKLLNKNPDKDNY